MSAHDQEIETLLTTAAGLERGALLELAAEPSGDDAAKLERARATGREAIASRRVSDELERVGSAIIRWSGVGGALSGVYTFASSPADLMLADLRSQVVPALMDAAMALLLGDALDVESRDALLDRWRQVTSPSD